MKPGSFRYHRPATIDEAVALLAEHGDQAKLIAGGQSLVPMMNMRLAQPQELIDVNGVAGLDSIREDGAFIEIGALARHQELADSELLRWRCPLLAEAAAGIGHYAIRQRGTIGGSLASADPAAQLPLIAVTLDAQIATVSPRGRRTLRAAEFFRYVMTTALEPDEIIVAVRFPVFAAGEGSAYQAFARRSGDFAIVAVAADVLLHAGRVERLRLGLRGVAATPVRFDALAAALQGRAADEHWAGQAALLYRDGVEVDDSPRIPAIYRRELVEVLVKRALLRALERARTNS